MAEMEKYFSKVSSPKRFVMTKSLNNAWGELNQILLGKREIRF